jgi:hypothetical protein
MATSDILGLFATPQQYEQQRQAAMEAQALQQARLSPMEQGQFGIALGAQQLGRAIGGALGGEDPQLKMISQRQQFASHLNQSNPESFMKVAQLAAQSGDPQFAMVIADAGRQLQTGLATARKTTAEAQKAELTLTQEQNLRDELSRLPSDATEAQILGVVTKYGSPDKVLATLQASTDKAAQRDLIASQQKERLDAKAEQAKKDNDAKLERLQERLDAEARAAKERGATASMLKTMDINGRKEIEAIKTEFKKSQVSNKAMSGALIKDEIKDEELIDNLDAQITTLAPVVQNLVIDPKTNKAPLELGFLNNRKYELANATGNSTTESRAYANLERAVQAATNLKVSAEKGVQTDKDVLRFANEFLAAYGKNDTKTTFEALSNFVKATQTAKEKTQIRIDKRRDAAKVEPLYRGNSLSDEDLLNKYK